MKFLAMGAIVITLTGCATLEDAVLDNFRPVTDVAIKSCEKIGYQRNTEPWRQCVMSTANNMRQSNAASGSRSSTVYCRPFLNGMMCD